MKNIKISNKDKCLLVFELLKFAVQILTGIFAIIFILHCLFSTGGTLTDYVFVCILALLNFAVEVCIDLIDRDKPVNYWKLVNDKKLKNKEILKK